MTYGRRNHIGVRPTRERMFGMTSSLLYGMPAMFDGFVEQSRRASSICLITFKLNRYSVPASFANHYSACGFILSGWSLQPRRNIL